MRPSDNTAYFLAYCSLLYFQRSLVASIRHLRFARTMLKIYVLFKFRQCVTTQSLSQIALKGALYGLREFFATEKPLKLIKILFYFTLKALFILKIFILLD